MLELELDFSDHEDLEFAQRPQLLEMASELKDEMENLASTFTTGNTIKNGIPVAIVGKSWYKQDYRNYQKCTNHSTYSKRR